MSTQTNSQAAGADRCACDVAADLTRLGIAATVRDGQVVLGAGPARTVVTWLERLRARVAALEAPPF